MDSTHRARAGWRYASGKGVSTGQAEGGGGGEGCVGTLQRRTRCLTNGTTKRAAQAS